VSLPPAWFTDLEKTIILSVVCELYGDARKFLADLNDESVSFYRRASEAVGHGETCDEIVAIIHELHEKGVRGHENEIRGATNHLGGTASLMPPKVLHSAGVERLERMEPSSRIFIRGFLFSFGYYQRAL
jgi:hypothetical protein